MNGRTRSGLFLALAAAVTASPALAQSGIERIEELTRLGRAQEARVALTEWWEGDREDASRRELQRGLWLRGRLTVDPVQAELDFQRLAVMYPSGRFTPQAILRLAQASFAMGDEEEARRYIGVLVRDYPSSEARGQGEAWLSAAGPVPPPGDTPTRGVAAEEQPDAPAPAADSAEVADDAREGDPAESPAPVMNYYVQLGAFADEARAIALYEQVRESGVEARVVRVDGSRFTHVRVGRFADRADAVEQLDELTAAGVSAALVRDDRAEEVVRN
jgi:cell division septation protein DedD